MPLVSDHITVKIPPELRTRAKTLARRYRSSIGQMIRDSLLEKVEFLEAKIRQEEEERRRKKEEKPARSLRTLEERRASAAPPSGMPPLPDLPSAAPPPPEPHAIEADALVADVYEQEAKKIFAVLDNPPERRLRTAEAVAAVKRVHPLTHPQDVEILLKLERIVLELRAKAPPKRLLELEETRTGADAIESRLAGQIKRVTDVFVARTIDASKIQSHGDVDSDDADDNQKGE